MTTPLIDTWKNARYAALASQIQDAYKKGEEGAFSRFFNNNTWDSTAYNDAKVKYGAEQAKEQSNIYNDLASQAALMELQLAQADLARQDALAEKAQAQANWEKSFGLGQAQNAQAQANWEKSFGLSQSQQAQQQTNLDREYALAVENRDYTRAQALKAQIQADQEKRQAALNAGWMGDQIKTQQAMSGGGAGGDYGGGDMATHDQRWNDFMTVNNPYGQTSGGYTIYNPSNSGIGGGQPFGGNFTINSNPFAGIDKNSATAQSNDWTANNGQISGAQTPNKVYIGYGATVKTPSAAQQATSMWGPTNIQMPGTLASAPKFYPPGTAWGARF